jgi:hypothetical protein
LFQRTERLIRDLFWSDRVSHACLALTRTRERHSWSES